MAKECPRETTAFDIVATICRGRLTRKDYGGHGTTRQTGEKRLFFGFSRNCQLFRFMRPSLRLAFCSMTCHPSAYKISTSLLVNIGEQRKTIPSVVGIAWCESVLHRGTLFLREDVRLLQPALWGRRCEGHSASNPGGRMLPRMTAATGLMSQLGFFANWVEMCCPWGWN